MFGPWLARARMQGDLQRQHDVRAMLSAATVTTAAAHEQLRAEHDASVQQRDVEMALMNDALKALESQGPLLAREATEAMHGASPGTLSDSPQPLASSRASYAAPFVT